MAISAADVKKLREMTGAGMMDCKKALVEADGDIEQAVVLLREKGLSGAAKKASRITAEGLTGMAIADDQKSAALVEVNSETDFVAKNEEFQEFVAELAKTVLANKPADIEALKACEYPGSGKTVGEVLTDKIAKIGENMSIRRFAVEEQEQGLIVGYVHGAGKIAVLVNLKSDAPKESLESLGKDLAMQVASMKPKYISRDDVDQDYIDREKEVLMHLALNENEEEIKAGRKGKPENIIEKMVAGRLQKELKEVCLLEQVFVKDTSMSVAQVIADAGKSAGAPVEVVSAVRYEVGEGVEKREENFAEEVAKQMGQ